MNTAAGLVTPSPLQVALQLPADPAATAETGGEFTAVLAAACAAQPEAGMPEGMESAAALAWLSGIVNAAQPVSAPNVVATPVESGSLPVVETQPASDVALEPTLDILQEMLAPVVPEAPVKSSAQIQASAAVESRVESTLQAVVDSALATIPEVVDIEPEVALAPEVTAGETDAGDGATTTIATVEAAAAVAAMAARPVVTAPVDAADDAPAETGTGIAAAVVAADAESGAAVAPQRAAPVIATNPLLKTQVADPRPELRTAVQDEAGTGATTGADAQSPINVPVKPDVGERLINALAERVSSRPEGTGTPVEVDRSVIGGTNPYASAREALASVAGQVSTRPEVVHSTVGSPRWANELGSRLLMMSVRGQQEGSLSLTPEHLGPVEVRISVNQDSTNVWFGAQHADTRAALADALPRLRELFAASGLALGQAGVSHEAPGQPARRGEGFSSHAPAEAEPVEIQPARLARITSGLLDTWA